MTSGIPPRMTLQEACQIVARVHTKATKGGGYHVELRAPFFPSDELDRYVEAWGVIRKFADDASSEAAHGRRDDPRGDGHGVAVATEAETIRKDARKDIGA